MKRSPTRGPAPSAPSWGVPEQEGLGVRLLCQMVFDANIDVNGIWIMTLSVAGASLLLQTALS